MVFVFGVLGVLVCKIGVNMKIGRHHWESRGTFAFFLFVFHLAIICCFLVFFGWLFVRVLFGECFVVLCCGCPK